MATLGEIVRWFAYGISNIYLRVAGRLMRRDRLLLRSERKFRALLESAPDAIVIVDWHGHVALVNEQTEKLFGYPRREIIGQRVDELIPKANRGRHREHMKKYMRDAKRRPMGTGLDLQGRRKDGTEFPVEISLSPLSTDGGLLVSAAIRDITERKKDEERLRYLADHDPLTGLLNRRRFEEELSRDISRASRYRLDGTMVLIDIDGLKDVNDTLGHAQGDELIHSFAELIASRMRDTDLVARLGGDEFGILMPNTPADAAQAVATDLLRTIRNHGVVLGAHRLRPSACAGIATYSHGRVDSGDVMVAADLALYDAKQYGPGQIETHAPTAQEHAQFEQRATWLKRIRRALDEELLVPYRQPIMNLHSRTVGQYELLARLLDDDGKPIAPGAFLPTAERSGMVRELDRRMASWAIDLIADSQVAGAPVSYEVNLSARSLGDPALAAMLTTRIGEAGIDPSLLVFEITETAAIANMEQARGFAGRLRQLGCRFALDDFGAGFASFYYLKHIPLDALKIDGDFVRGLRSNPTDQLVVKHIAEIAASLGLLTIAEFVEDEETLEILAGYGIDAVQGYHIGRPEPAEPLDRVTPPADPGARPDQGLALRPPAG